MALLQVLAAGSAGVDRLVFHTGQPGGEAPVADANAFEADLVPQGGIETSTLLDRVVARRFLWGLSEGT